MTDRIIISRSSGLIEAEVEGELIALHVDKGTCYGFNVTATRVWQLLEQPKSLAELCETLTGEYSVESDACEREVLALLKDLESDGLVEIRSQPGGAK